MVSENFTLLKFEDVVVPAASYLYRKQRYGIINSKQVNEYWDRKEWTANNVSLPHVLHKSFQFDDRMCVTNKREYKKDLVIEREEVAFNVTKLIERPVTLKFYLHQNGQLTKDLRHQIFTIDAKIRRTKVLPRK